MTEVKPLIGQKKTLDGGRLASRIDAVSSNEGRMSIEPQSCVETAKFMKSIITRTPTRGSI